jgi:hypothetical protein
MIDPADSVDYVLDLLKVTVPTRIATLNAEAGAHVQLEAPSSEERYYFSRPDYIPDYPAIAVAFSDDESDAPFRIDSREVELLGRGVVVVWNQHEDIETMQRMSYRWTRLLMDVMVADDAWGPNTWPTKFRRLRRSQLEPLDPLAEEPDSFCTSSGIEVLFKRNISY